MASTMTLRRLLTGAGLAAVCLAAGAGMVASASGAQASATVAAHNPIGRVDSVAAVGASAVQFVGWAADPDQPQSDALVTALVDGVPAAHVTTSISRPVVQRLHGLGATPGFVVSVPVPRDGAVHTACIAARNVGAGMATLLKCIAVPLGRQLSAAQVAAHSPRASITLATAGRSTLNLQGWAVDPDYLARRATVLVYVDGVLAATAITGPGTLPSPRPAGVGSLAAFDVTVPVAPGAHEACAWVVNIGLGQSHFVSCRARDTRGPLNTGTVTEPAVNAKVVTEADKHIGQPYVWGAAGPTSFDCSGLVTYSYSKQGVTTPRVAADQFRAARLISAARAVPGDLVFYHDQLGHVYHVGIYTGPGATVAAIDPAEGVDVQPIWEPLTATYGSFTHS